MKRFVFIIITALCFSVCQSQTRVVSLGTFKNRIAETEFEVRACFNEQTLIYAEFECLLMPKETKGIIRIKAKDLPLFVESLNRIESELASFKTFCLNNNYSDIRTEANVNFPKVDYIWDDHQECNSQFDILLQANEDSSFTSCILHEAFDDGASANFFMQFYTPYEINILALRLCEDNIDVHK